MRDPSCLFNCRISAPDHVNATGDYYAVIMRDANKDRDEILGSQTVWGGNKHDLSDFKPRNSRLANATSFVPSSEIVYVGSGCDCSEWGCMDLSGKIALIERQRRQCVYDCDEYECESYECDEYSCVDIGNATCSQYKCKNQKCIEPGCLVLNTDEDYCLRFDPNPDRYYSLNKISCL